MTVRRPPAWLAATLLTAGACSVQIAGNDHAAIIRGTVFGDGAALAGASVLVGDAGTTSFGDGTFVLNLKSQPDRIVLTANAVGFMPMTGVVEVRGGVYNYRTDLALIRPTALAAGAETTIALGGRMFKVKAPPGIVADGGHLDVGVFSAEAGPGEMETTEGNAQRLQSLGLFYLRAVDAAGRPIQLLTTAGAQTVTFSIASDLLQLTDSQDAKAYTLGDDGQWVASTTASATGTLFAAPEAGYWHAARAYKTACIRGKLSAPTKTCAGERVRVGVGSVDGVYSQDTTGVGGEFCVEGPQSRSETLSIGSKSLAVTFPAVAGSCRQNPTACTEIPAVGVLDADCPAGCLRPKIDDPAGCK